MARLLRLSRKTPVTLKWGNEKEARMAGRKETNQHPVIEDWRQPTEDEIREHEYQKIACGMAVLVTR
jgi:hypothetical protein